MRQRILDFVRRILGLKKDLTRVEYPTAFHTADMIPFAIDDSGDMVILLGQKPNRLDWQCIGGFIDPSDPSAEKGALRELSEEANIFIKRKLSLSFPELVSSFEILPSDFNRTLKEMYYIGSINNGDERYINSIHKIITSIYTTRIYYNQSMLAGDDIVLLKWFKCKDLFQMSKSKNLNEFESTIRPVHRQIITNFLNIFR